MSRINVSFITVLALAIGTAGSSGCGEDKGGGGTAGAPGSSGSGGRGGSSASSGGGSPGSTGGTGGSAPAPGGTSGQGGSVGTGGQQADGSAAAAPDASGGEVPPAGPGPGEGWTLRWNNEAAGRGLGGFEGEETAECTHAGVPHASIAEGKVKIEMHYPADTDCKAGDRQRNEVKGMSLPTGGYVPMKEGETWLLSWDMFIPPTLNATTSFTHIHQIFAAVGTMATNGPIVTISLHTHDGTDSIEMRIDGNSGPHWSATPLAPIQNRWVRVEYEVKWASAGTIRWTIRDGEKVYLNANRTWNGWHGGERMRPKWGIYRNRGSAGLMNTHILLDNFKAYSR